MTASTRIQLLRNVAIIAHVDHGKTTLVDKLLQQSGALGSRAPTQERIMDSNALEKERGITILAKNTTLHWHGHQINVVDTPGHADFGGEVERILSMVDSVLLLVDALDGPMPQTRFVTQKAFSHGLHPILVVNKIDRPGARPEWVVDQVFDLFDRLGATEEQLDFPIIYASALMGYAVTDWKDKSDNMDVLFQAIVDKCPAPVGDASGTFQMRISALDYSSYVGAIGIGRVERGRVKPATNVSIVDRDGHLRTGRVLQVLGNDGLKRIELTEAEAGDIIAVTGVDGLRISDTLCDPTCVEALPALTVDEPTVSMTFQVNDSPFAGKEGKFVTSRQIRDRLERELIHNVALRVEDTSDPDKFLVSGRGELHLGILIETMRREGYELAVSRPQVIIKEVDGIKHEPFELVVLDIQDEHQGSIMERLGERRAELLDMLPDGQGRVRLEYVAPARALIGFHSEFMTLTSGSGLMHRVFHRYDEAKGGSLAQRKNGVLISNAQGKATGYSLWKLQERGRIMIDPQTEVYEGMIVGIHSRENDLVVNVIKGKQLTNIRASGTDENIVLVPPIRYSLERAIEFINDDELVEVTPISIRIRKRYLKEHERKRSGRED